MAIFTGTWKDGDGVPFDSSAHLVTTYSPGGAAAVNPRRPPGPRHRAHFRTVAQHLGHLWREHTTHPDKAAWKIVGGHQIWSRKSDQPALVNGFLAWNATAFLHAFYDPADPPTPPGETTAGDFFLMDVTAAAGAATIDYQLDWSWDFHDDPDNYAAIYQCNPGKVGDHGHQYNTRLLAIHDTFAWPVPDAGWFSVPAQFRIFPGHTARVMIRAGHRRRWQTQQSDTCIIAP